MLFFLLFPLLLLFFSPYCSVLFFFNDTATTEIYTLSLHDALPILMPFAHQARRVAPLLQALGDRRLLDIQGPRLPVVTRSEEHTSELQSLRHLVCRLLLEKKKNK